MSLIKNLVRLFRNRVEGVLILIAGLPVILILLLSWPVVRSRRDASGVIRRWVLYVLRGLRPIREAWWVQFDLAAYGKQWRYLFLLEFFNLLNCFHCPTRNPGTCMVCTYGHLGDLLHHEPLFRNLAAQGKQPDMLAGPWAKPLFEDSPLVHKLIVHAPALRQYTRGDRSVEPGFLEEIRFLLQLRKTGYEEVMTTGYDSFLYLLLILAMHPARAVVTVWRQDLYRCPDAVEVRQVSFGGDTYEAERLVQFAGPSQEESVAVHLELPFPLDQLPEMKELFPRVGKRVAMAPGGGWKGKCWLPDRYHALVENLKDFGVEEILLLGTPDEKELCSSIAADRSVCKNLAGRTSLLEALALIRESDLFIGNDSGLLHGAAAMGTSTLALFGPTSPKAWAPKGTGHRVIRGGDGCKGCVPWHLDGKCLHNGVCMKAIAVEEVAEAASELLSEQSA